MGNGKHIITRRDFLRAGTCVTMGSLMGFPLMSHAVEKKSVQSRVVLIREKDAVGSSEKVSAGALEDMMDQAISTLMKAPDAASAWQKLIKPEDIVGIKSNVWHYLPTPKTLEDVIKERLIDTGVKQENISVDDRGVRNDPVFQQSTALINIRPMRTHHWSGLGTLLKNYIMFVSHPWMYHGNTCERLGTIWHKDAVKGKTRLNILVMLTPLFHGIGPHHFSRKYTWPYGGLILSTDPVAADATGARIIQAKRDEYFGKEKPISPPPHHIVAADVKFNLGNSHPDRIQLIKLGWDEGILI